MSPPIHNILHVEDDENDRVLLKIACRQSNLPVELHEVKNGQAALDYLRGSEMYSNRERYPFPALVLLDLKMPQYCGLEVLAWIREQPTMKSLPVIVLTYSEHEQDKNRALALEANAYYIKPLDIEPLMEIMRQIYSEWLGVRDK